MRTGSPRGVTSERYNPLRPRSLRGLPTLAPSSVLPRCYGRRSSEQQSRGTAPRRWSRKHSPPFYERRIPWQLSKSLPGLNHPWGLQSHPGCKKGEATRCQLGWGATAQRPQYLRELLCQRAPAGAAMPPSQQVPSRRRLLVLTWVAARHTATETKPNSGRRKFQSERERGRKGSPSPPAGQKRGVNPAPDRR